MIVSSLKSPPSTCADTSRTPVALFCTYFRSQSEWTRLSWTSTRLRSVWKVELIQLITESKYSGKPSIILMIWPASIEPSSVMNPAVTISSPKKTRKAASPRRMPYEAIQLTAGSIASARKNAIRMLINSPMSWWNAQLPSWNRATSVSASTIARGSQRGMRAPCAAASPPGG